MTRHSPLLRGIAPLVCTRDPHSRSRDPLDTLHANSSTKGFLFREGTLEVVRGPGCSGDIASTPMCD